MSVLRTGCFHRTVEELHFVSNTHGHTQIHTSMKSVHNNLYNRWKEVFVKPFLSISLVLKRNKKTKGRHYMDII